MNEIDSFMAVKPVKPKWISKRIMTISTVCILEAIKSS